MILIHGKHMTWCLVLYLLYSPLKFWECWWSKKRKPSPPELVCCTFLISSNLTFLYKSCLILLYRIVLCLLFFVFITIQFQMKCIKCFLLDFYCFYFLLWSGKIIGLFWVWFFERGFLYSTALAVLKLFVAQAGIELTELCLPLPFKWWEKRYAPLLPNFDWDVCVCMWMYVCI